MVTNSQNKTQTLEDEHEIDEGVFDFDFGSDHALVGTEMRLMQVLPNLTVAEIINLRRDLNALLDNYHDYAEPMEDEGTFDVMDPQSIVRNLRRWIPRMEPESIRDMRITLNDELVEALVRRMDADGPDSLDAFEAARALANEGSQP